MKKDSDENPGRAGYSMLGALLGVMFVIIWAAFLLFVGRNLFPHPSISESPITHWLYLGPVVFLISAGNYLMNHRKLNGVEADRAAVELKIMLLGTLLWFPVPVALSFVQWDGPVRYSTIGGYLTMLAMLTMYLLWKRSAARRNSPESADPVNSS